MPKEYWIVWNHEDKDEGVVFDNYDDAYQTAYGTFSQMAPAIGENFHEYYGEDGQLEIQKIELT